MTDEPRVTGRKITATEAIAHARGIMRRAEGRRAETARAEAERMRDEPKQPEAVYAQYGGLRWFANRDDRPGPLPLVPSCEGCGACCAGMAVPPLDEFEGLLDHEDPEYQALPPHLQQEIDAAWKAGPVAGTPCIWLDQATRRCKHYEYRPVICVSFEPGNPICLEDIELQKRRQSIAPEPHAHRFVEHREYAYEPLVRVLVRTWRGCRCGAVEGDEQEGKGE